MKRRRTQNFSPLGHGQLGGAAADIDVKNSTLSLGRQGDRAGAMGGKQRFEIVARAGADEVAALRGEEVGNRSRVFPANGLAGENDGTGVHLLGSDFRLLIGSVNEVAKRLLVDAFSTLGVRSEVDWREVEGLSLGHHKTARQFTTKPA